MSAARRSSARRSSPVKQSQVNGLSAPTSPSPKGKETAYSRDTDAAVISPIIKNGMDSSNVDVLAASASTSNMTQASATNGSVVVQALKEAAMLGTTRSSSEELTDIEELDKALTSVAKKAAPRKRKAKGKEVAKAEDENHNEAKGENGASEPKPKAKRKRTKKVQGPYLPVVDYPARDLEGKKFIGAHVSISDGAHYAPHRALRIGARAFALFVKSQRQWAGKPLSDDSVKLFPLRCKGKTETIPNEEGESSIVTLGDGIGFDALKHIVPHGSYLTNLCHNGEEQRKKSYDNFLTELKMAETLGIGLFNIHPGSCLGADRNEAYAYLAQCINDAHRETKFTTVLLENMASGKNIIGGSFEDLAAIIALVKDKSRIGVCFDTCHGFAAGYDLRTEDVYNDTWKKFDDIIGLKYLKAFHVNDSMKELGSRRDLHQNIGAGELGLSSFHLLMRDPRFDGLPFILETPMLSGSLNVDAKPEANGASTSKAKLEVKAEEEVLETYDPSAGNEADVEDEISGQAGLTLGASTWKQEIELLEELQRVPFGQTNEKIDKLSSDIRAIVADYQRRQEEQQKAAKEAKDALKEAKKAAEKAEKGEQPEKEKKPRAPRKRTSKKKEVETKVEEVEREPSEEMEIDSSEVDQLASDYEEPPPKL